MDTRRIYISSSDAVETFPNTSKIRINLENAHIRCDNNELLALSLVKASLPSTINATPNTTVNSTTQGDDCYFLNYTYNGVNYLLYINQFNEAINTSHSGYTVNYFRWCAETTIQDLLTKINETIGNSPPASPIITLGATTYFGRLWNSTSINFIIQKESSPSILKALGCVTDADTILVYNNIGTVPIISVPKYQVNMGNLLPVVYLKTDQNIESFCSVNNGSYQNILGSVPINMESNFMGKQVISITSSGSDDFIGIMDNQINYTNHSLSGSHKPITAKKITNIFLEFVNNEMLPIEMNNQEWECVVEVKKVKIAG